ncbi:amino acid ABC transporter permease [Marinivivus vitaminiproducens]|uniref:amino acid ABC transporter permease n=1 Tax=Marinivivus vitaminiproducens TaxID=3035935 RepID=UPI0027A34DF0|nr:amino acid ABC transporter permease [Geminicoccaceae bacterium SCSIO 64248]
MNYDFRWDYIWANGPALMQGLWLTLQISTISILIAAAIGVLGASIRVARVPVLSPLIAAYVEFVRNTPLLVQIFFIFFGLPSIGLGLSLYASGILALSLWGGAFNVENVRGGFLSVPQGLVEASRSLGLRPWHYTLKVAIPLALRVSIPAMLNTSISVLKNSSYLQAIGMVELTFVAMERVASEYRTLEMFLAIGVLYLGLVLILSFLVRRLEHRLNAPFRQA